MKKNKKISVCIGVFIIVLFCVFLFIPKGINHGIVTSGQVIKKDYHVNFKYPYTVDFKILNSETSSGTEVVKIAVKDVMIWNLIEKNRFYFVNCQWINSDIPVLYQIEHNDKFGNIYKEKFLK